MNEKDISEKFKKFSVGTYLDITLDRGNGEFCRTYFYQDIDGEYPVLELYDGRNSENRSYLDLGREDVNIVKIGRTPLNSFGLPLV